ncbi:MAG: hypothetical protein ABIV50_11550 [Opitutus sp.]
MNLSRLVGSSIALTSFTICGHDSWAAAAAVLPNVTITASEVITLWPSGAPGETGQVGTEHVLPDRPRPFDQITDVTEPTLAVFLPPKDMRNGTAMLVTPGGGLERLALEHEGYEVAEWLNQQGIAAFVLKYRVPPRDPQHRWKVGVQDAQRAMGIIRSRADEWFVDRQALGSIGFSAGAEIDLILSVSTAAREYPPIDAADALSSRPDFNIAMYGGGFADFRTNELRADIAQRINKTTPPMFVAHAFDDQALSSIILMNALKRANVTSELHIFSAGAHGFGVRESGLTVGHWRELCLNWLRWQGFLDSAGVRAYANDWLRSRQQGARLLPRYSTTPMGGDAGSALAVQGRLVRHAVQDGDEIIGYQAALASNLVNAGGTAAPALPAVLLKSGRIDASTKTVAMVRAELPVMIETTIGYVIATDIGSKLRVPRQAISSVEAIVPVVELREDLATKMAGAVTLLDAVAVNFGSNRTLIGPAQSPESFSELKGIRIALQRDGQSLANPQFADAIRGQGETLMLLINQIIDAGHVIHRGDMILTGPTGETAAGERGLYVAEFGALGRIAFRIE